VVVQGRLPAGSLAQTFQHNAVTRRQRYNFRNTNTAKAMPKTRMQATMAKGTTRRPYTAGLLRNHCLSADHPSVGIGR
jgi:hypothetical protein